MSEDKPLDRIYPDTGFMIRINVECSRPESDPSYYQVTEVTKLRCMTRKAMSDWFEDILDELEKRGAFFVKEVA